jgi:NAD(P)-dependent dehydrogenase (short-subunit alcohol dehydrogenase family)
VRAFTEQFLSDFSTLDILINNAAVMATPQTKTSDGFEMQFGTNHLGHFALFTGIAPALLAAPTSRVVALSSIGHRRSPVVFEDIMFENRPYEKWSSYGQSKTACSLFAVGVNELYGSKGITANAVHPGGIITGLQQYLPREEQIAMGWFTEEGTINERFKTVEQGASTSTWAAVGVELEGRGGHYLEDCAQALPVSKESPMSGVEDYAINPELAMRLWEVSSELIAK